MPIPKKEASRKTEIVADVTETLRKSQAVVLAEYRGLTVSQTSEIRKKLQETGTNFAVVKNTLFKRAADGLIDPDPGFDATLNGPTAVAFAEKDPVETAKAILDYLAANRNSPLKVKGVVVGRRYFPPDRLEALSKTPPKEQLLAEVLGYLQSPLSGLAGVLNGVLRDAVSTLQAIVNDLVYTLQAIVDKMQAEGTTNEGKTMALTKEQLIEGIENITVLELVDLVKTLQEKFGVSAAAPMAMPMPGVMPAAPAGNGAAPAAPVVEEQTAFDVILKAAGDKKIQVIKVVREITGLGLKEAKELVDTAPKPVKEGLSKEDAEKIKNQLAGEGADVEIK